MSDLNDDFDMIQLDLPPDLETAAKQASARSGVSLAEFILEALVEKLSAKSDKPDRAFAD